MWSELAWATIVGVNLAIICLVFGTEKDNDKAKTKTESKNPRSSH